MRNIVQADAQLAEQLINRSQHLLTVLDARAQLSTNARVRQLAQETLDKLLSYGLIQRESGGQVA